MLIYVLRVITRKVYVSVEQKFKLVSGVIFNLIHDCIHIHTVKFVVKV